MKRHVKCNHNLLEHKRFNCNQELCQRPFGSVQSLYRHIKRQHNRPIKKPHVGYVLSDITNSQDEVSMEVNSLEDEPENSSMENNDSIYSKVDSFKNADEACPKHLGGNGRAAEFAFILNLYAMPNLTRRDVDTVISFTTNLLDIKCNQEGEHFNNLTSEYLIKKKFETRGLLPQHQSIFLGYELDDTVKKGDHYELVRRPIYGEYVGIENILQTIFRSSSLLELALDYMQTKNPSNDIADFKDSLKCVDDPETLPYVLFFDEIECGNALGSHKGINKLGAIYLSLRCLPPHFYSCLKNIYICCLFPTTDPSFLQLIINKLVEEMVRLSTEGMTVNGKMLYFQFAGILGDNLGLHQFLGFTESFAANYPCRFCKVHKKDMGKMVKEDPLLLRTKASYDNDIQKDMSESGVSRSSPLNTIPNYHVIDNGFVDVMHDLLEGVAKFGMYCIIKFYIDNKTFSLEDLNSRVRTFPYGNASNKPPPITRAHILKGDLVCSAAETLNLVLYFGLMVGDLINESCEVWLYYLTLRHLVDIVLLKVFTRDHVKYIQSLVEEHHLLYMSLFKKHLKPKHHFLLHYGSALLNTGPFTHNWGMRFESKHTIVKLVANVTKSRVNLCKSVVIRTSYMSAYDTFMSQKRNIGDIYELGPRIGSVTDLQYRWVNRRGVRYSLEDVVCLNTSDDEGVPSFAVIKKLTVVDDIVMCDLLSLVTNYFDIHRAAYAVSKPCESILQIRCNINNIVSRPLAHVGRNKIHYVADVGLR